MIINWGRCFLCQKEIIYDNYCGCNLCGALSVALVMVRGKKEKSINLGKSSEETDEQSYWNPDIHGIAKSEDGYYYLTYDIDGTTLRYFDDTAKEVYSCMCKA